MGGEERTGQDKARQSPLLYLLILLFILFFFTPLFSTLFFPLSTDLLQYLCSVDDYLNTQTKYHSYS